MHYHSAQQRSASVEVDADTAVLVGRSFVDATIWSARGTWHLQLTTEYQQQHGQWRAMRTVATAF
jgi:hypothetical protein